MEREAARLPLPPGARLAAVRRSGELPALRLAQPAPAGAAAPLAARRRLLPRLAATHAAMVAALARARRLGAVLPDYRLAPEHAFPAAVEDALAAWEALRAEGWRPARIVLGGDSAGGGLAFALLHLLLAAGEPPPAGVVAFSPWVDLTLVGREPDAPRPPRRLPARARLAEIRDLYLAGADPRDPRASPRLGRFAGAPPVLIQASRAEILRDDARAMAARLAADGAAADARPRARRAARLAVLPRAGCPRPTPRSTAPPPSCAAPQKRVSGGRA